jgi:hypothetical protein
MRNVDWIKVALGAIGLAAWVYGTLVLLFLVF